MSETQVGEKSYTLAELQDIQAAMGWGQKDVNLPHGSAGLLSSPGVRPDMYSTIPAPSNFASAIPVLPSQNNKEVMEILTSQLQDTGTNPEATCDDAPVAGQLQAMQFNVMFGKYWKGTPTIDLTEVGLRRDYADVDRRILNSPNLNGNPFMPAPALASPNAINSPRGKILMEFGHSAMRDFSYCHMQGDYSKPNTSTRLGFIKEYKGLDGWIKTGYVDSVSNAPAPTADSRVISINASLDATAVLRIMDLYRLLKTDADIVGMPGTVFAIVVHPRMMFSLFDVWACNYQQARCLIGDDGGADTGRRLDVTQITALREAMIAGRYLLMDGERVPVLFDFGMAATQAEDTGTWTSDLFIVPISNNGRALTYFQYLPFTNSDVSEFVRDVDEFRIINNGLYLVTHKRSGTCISFQFASRNRLVMDTPFLAARADDIQFNAIPIRDVFQESTYFLGGGTNVRPA